jgi:serine/threonine protein kinase
MEVGKIIDNKYKILKELARGGFAIVYKGWDMLLNRFVAIKRTMENFAHDTTFIKMFADEAYNTAQLTHTNIVQVYDFRKTRENIFYIIMEYVKGKNLSEILERKGAQKLPPALACYIIDQVLKGLAYAHHKRDERTGIPLNIVHRDVSPSNIMVSYDGQVKLTDFGIAKASLRRVEATGTGVLKGKISYMSPEQVAGEKIDHRSDLFSVAVILYELLANEKLFPVTKNEVITLQKIMNAEVDFEKVKEKIPSPRLEEILRKGLAKEPKERFENAAKFSAALEGYLRDNPCDEVHLSEFMNSLFKKEIKEEEKEKPLVSLQVSQSASVVETVALETPSEILKARAKTRGLEETTKELVTKRFRVRRKTLGLSVGGVFLFLSLFFYFSFLTPVYLTITSIPSGAEVSLKGKELGETPLTFRVSSGELILLKEGYTPLSSQIKQKGRKIIVTTSRGEIKEFKNKDRLNFTFEAPLVITSYPEGAKVLVNDEIIGTTPVRKLIPVSGSYKIKVTLPGFKATQCQIIPLAQSQNLPSDWEFKEKLIEGKKEYSLSVVLLKELSVSSIPPKAAIYLNNIWRGYTPQKLYLKVGEYALKCQKAGYKTLQLKLIVTKESANTLSIELKEKTTVKKEVVGEIVKEVSPEVKVEKREKIVGRSLIIEPIPPDARVFVDGEEKGRGRQVLTKLTADEYIIVISHPTYKKALTKIVKFTKIDQRLRVSVRHGKIVVGEE